MSLKVRCILVLVIGTVLGLTVSLGSSVLAELEARLAARNSATLPARSVQRLAEVIERVRREYVDQIDDERLIESAIRGVLAELDSHSRYLDARAYEDIRIATTGNYSGVGLDVRVEDGRVTVVTPLDGGPAERVGILPGDVLISVDDMPVNGDNVEETTSRMRGTPGTPVTIGILRDGTEDPLRFALTRAEINVKTIRAAYFGDGYGYIRLTGFSDSTAHDLDEAARALNVESETKLKGLVLDLRNNPGGVLDAAVQVADRFIDEGLIVRGVGRIRQARFEKRARAGDELEQVPLVVLVNSGSASASEIVAGAVQDHDRGEIVGERTYGKGSVQTVLPISEGNAIKLTTSRYIMSSGRSINGVGIYPDVVVRNADPRRQYRGPGGSVAAGDDQQLQQALRLIGYDPVALSELQ
ncbi:S41 family peptidase [Candidatus Rariloculus sp.]|uniref:S41 family peptidase n=1 Tax=Candidatus Rariloculus sp. TaxID=3101265 RepID=UPI003D0EA2A6